MRVKDASNDEILKWRCLFRSQFVEWVRIAVRQGWRGVSLYRGVLGVFACLLHLWNGVCLYRGVLGWLLAYQI
jgi:hypothetical protein